MNISPWARLITRMSPKMMASPIATRASTEASEMPFRSVVSTSPPDLPSTHWPRTAPRHRRLRGDPRDPAAVAGGLDLVFRVEDLEGVPVVALGLGHVECVARVLGRRVDGDVALRRVETDAFQPLDQLIRL